MSEAITKIFEEIFGTKEKEMDKEFEELKELGSSLAEKAITLALQELTQKEKENSETAGKYDPRSLSIARTKLEDAVLLLIDTKENVSTLFQKVNARNEAEITSLVIGAKRWILNSENPEILKENIENLKDVEVNEPELAASALLGLFKAMKL